MRQHAGQGPPGPLAAVGTAPLGPVQQALRLRERLGPGIEPGEIVSAYQMLVKVLGRETLVALAVQPLHFRLGVKRNPFARRFAKPQVVQAFFALFLKTLAPAPERPLANP